MYWWRFKFTSPWAGGKFKVFFFKGERPELPLLWNPGNDGAIASYTYAEAKGLYIALGQALKDWPEDQK